MADVKKKDFPFDCSDADNEKPVSFLAVLWEELDEIGKLRRKREWEKRNVFGQKVEEAAAGKGDEQATSSRPSDDEVVRAAHEQELVGLAFSGGGIRSATFNLGVLQGFATLGLLPMFDYLSTVSGGGYIGGWLESWIYRARPNPDDPNAAKVAKCASSSEFDSSPIRRVQECLKPDRSNKIDHSESQAIRFLREYSNYLTPRMGFLGADTWTAVAIYLRNLILNQTILILFLSFLLLMPYLAVYLTDAWTCYVAASKCPILLAGGGALAFLFLFLAFCGVGWNMDHLTGVGPTGEFPPRARQGWVLGYVATPVVLAVWCLCVWILQAQLWKVELWHKAWLVWMIGGAAGFFVAWSPVALWGIHVKAEKHQFWSARPTRFKSMGFSLLSGGTGGVLVWVVADKVIQKWAGLDGRMWHVVSFGPPLLIVVLLLVVTLQLGLMGRLTPDPRREWWGRLGGWMLLISIIWTAIFALAIYAPLGVVWSKKFVTYASLVWVLNTVIGVLGGKSGKTGAPESSSWKDAALSVTPYLFILGLAAGLATLLEIVLGLLNNSAYLWDFLKGSQVTEKVAGWIVSLGWYGTQEVAGYAQGTVIPATAQALGHPAYVAAHWLTLCSTLNTKLLICAVVVAVVCLFLAWRVDLNEFSMNLFYRNRLVRCYLGASHKFRRPNPFSGFDPHDDLLVSCMQAKNDYGGPFPIVNTALNLVTGQNLAWQERKAESFVITPLRCGFDTWLERLDLDPEIKSLEQERHDIFKYGFRKADCYLGPGGFRLGTAISISGAAASPNMGYHSSPSLAFLMTCFNVRLGFWAGNPRRKSTWMTAGPRFGLFRLIGELFGLSDDEARYVYLSDGGHFENLGLYELVKRRCKYIVVCDGDADGDYTFGDLGSAIRKCREDLGVDISVVTDNLTPGKPQAQTDSSSDSAAKTTNGANGADGDFCKKHWALGRIHYGLVDPRAGDGILVYLKTSLTSDEPADVLNYRREHADFPHQTTADQWFTESQFESYRRLGEHVVEKLFDGLSVTGRNTKEIFGALLETRGN